MPAYNYVAIAPDGKQKKGTIEAATESAAATAIKADGSIPITIDQPNLFNKELDISFGGKISSKHMAVFCKQFESILHAGVPVVTALDMIGEQTQNKRLKSAITNTRELVEKGETLSEAMEQQKGVFPSILINMVTSGEKTGNMETSFNRMATHFSKEAKLKGMIIQASIYPAILILVVIGVVAVMLIKIVPQFTETFAEADMELPAITKMVVAASNFLVEKWLIFALIIVGVGIAVKLIKQTDSGAMFFGKLAMKTPLIGPLTVKSAAARLTRTLSTLMASGISVVDAIQIVSKIISNRVIQSALEQAKEEVERGVPLSQPLEESGVFPPMVYQMTHIGEETGSMEEMMMKVADYYDEEVEAATKAITAVMEPMIIIVMAAVVLPIIFAILMPMLSMYGAAENA